MRTRESSTVINFPFLVPFLSLSLLDTSISGEKRLSTGSMSPKSLPDDNGCSAKLTEISSSKDDADLDNDNENISVTGSPDVTSDGDPRGDESKTEGAFTSIIQRSGGSRKSEFTSHFPVNSQFAAGGSTNPAVFNHALAAHLFFQNPLLPQPNQWLYNHLYNNYNDFPWLRHSLGSSNNSNNNTMTNGGSGELTDNASGSNNNNSSKPETASPPASSGLSFIKRSITLLTNNNNNNSINDKENDSDVQSSSSPPVSSSKRSLSPELIGESNGEIIASKRKRSSSVESITNENVNEINRQTTESLISRTRPFAAVKQNDVWRPY